MFWSTVLVDSAVETDELSTCLAVEGQVSYLHAGSSTGSPSLAGPAASRCSVPAQC